MQWYKTSSLYTVIILNLSPSSPKGVADQASILIGVAPKNGGQERSNEVVYLGIQQIWPTGGLGKSGIGMGTGSGVS